MACVSVAMVAGKDDSLEAGNTVSNKSVVGVSMNERIEVNIYFFNFVAGRKLERYLRSEVLPLPFPLCKKKKRYHQVPCPRQRERGGGGGGGDQYWGSAGILERKTGRKGYFNIIGVHFKENATQAKLLKALLIHLLTMRYFLESFITYSTKTFSQLFS